MTELLTFLLLLLIAGRCSWELLFLDEPLFQRNAPAPLIRGLALLSGLVSLVLLLDAAAAESRTAAVVVLAVTQLAYWFSALGKTKWGRGFNFFLRLLLTAGAFLHFAIAWKIRAGLGHDAVLISGLLVLVPVIAGLLHFIELLFNAAYSHGRKFSWKFFAEAGTAAALGFLFFQLSILHHA